MKNFPRMTRIDADDRNLSAFIRVIRGKVCDVLAESVTLPYKL